MGEADSRPKENQDYAPDRLGRYKESITGLFQLRSNDKVKASCRQIYRKGLADKENSQREMHELRVLKEQKRARWLEYGVEAGGWSERKAGARPQRAHRRGTHKWPPCPTTGDFPCSSMRVREAGLRHECP